jgi:uncharacterized protein (DUF736 family)
LANGAFEPGLRLVRGKEAALNEIIMAQIGAFTRGEDGVYAGTIKTLSLNIRARFVPTESSQNEKALSLRTMAGNVEIGAAWQRTSKENTPYHSVKPDDPSFPASIFASRTPPKTGAEFGGI